MNSEKLETTVEILKEMAFTATETQRRVLEDAISAISDYKKMQEISLDLAFENDELINKSRWIPVSERLPEKKVKDYLACCEDGYVATIMYDNGRWLINGNNVIAWMPLPEPYKAEKPETCKGCLEPCIMYEPDMRACKKKVTERGKADEQA